MHNSISSKQTRGRLPNEKHNETTPGSGQEEESGPTTLALSAMNSLDNLEQIIQVLQASATPLGKCFPRLLRGRVCIRDEGSAECWCETHSPLPGGDLASPAGDNADATNWTCFCS